MHFDRFDICAAYNLFSCLWGWDTYTHGIQVRLSRIQYRPAPLEEQIQGLTENGRAIFGALVRKHYPNRVGWARRARERGGAL